VTARHLLSSQLTLRRRRRIHRTRRRVPHAPPCWTVPHHGHRRLTQTIARLSAEGHMTGRGWFVDQAQSRRQTVNTFHSR